LVPPSAQPGGFGTKGCLHLRYQNLNWGLKIFDLVSCYCLGTPQGGFDLEDSPWQGSEAFSFIITKISNFGRICESHGPLKGHNLD